MMRAPIFADHASGPPPKRLSADRVAIYAFLITSAVFFLIPIYIMLATSVKPMAESRGGSALAWPAGLDFAAWGKAWASACIGLDCNGIRGGFWNSVAIVVPSVALSVIVGAINGYCL